MSLNIDGSSAASPDYACPAAPGTSPCPGAASAQGSSQRRFRPQLWPSLLVCVLIPLFISAGLWQWNKAAAKAERQRQMDLLGTQAAVELTARHDDAKALAFRKVVAQGRYDPQFQTLIDNRTHRGQAGYHVITPLRLEGSTVRLLVNRGWIPAPAEHRLVPSIKTPSGIVRISGVATIPPTRYFTLGTDNRAGPGGWQSVRQNLDLQRYGESVAFPILPVVVQLDPDNADGFVREWQRPDDRRQTNLAYALQWWAFAATTLALWLWFGFRRPLASS